MNPFALIGSQGRVSFIAASVEALEDKQTLQLETTFVKLSIATKLTA